jgi:hypothetical protein
MKKLHEFRHFARCGNLPYYGYKTKEREDERQIFKKRFPALKRNRIQNTSRISPIQGEHNGVGEYFFSLEEAFADWAFAIEPKLKPVYEWACAQARATEHTEQGQEQLFGFLQYLRDFMKDPFTDYYSARRDGIAYFNCKEVLFKRMARLLEGEKHSLAGHQDLRNIFEKSLASKFDQILNLVPSELRDEFIGSFRFLKNHFRSLYVDLDGGERRVVRPSSRQRTSLSETELFEEFADSVSFPEIAAPDTDIYLLKKHHKNVSRDFTPNQQRTLKSFLGNFEKFQQLSLEITGLMEKAGMTARGSSMFDLLYSFLYSHRCKEGDRVFEPKYRHSVAGINDRMKEVYQALASRLKDEGAQVVDYRGDYFFIKTNGDSPMNVPWLHKVRHLDEYSVGDRDTGAGTAELVF